MDFDLLSVIIARRSIFRQTESALSPTGTVILSVVAISVEGRKDWS
jgi:hypothetical protein